MRAHGLTPALTAVCVATFRAVGVDVWTRPCHRMPARRLSADVHQPLFEHRLRLAGVETRALELLGDGPPVLLVHGFMDSADTWRKTLASLAASGRAALAIDLPGFGAADRLVRGEPVLPQHDAVVAAAVEQLAEQGGGAVVVVGNSLGGCAAIRAAQRTDLPLAGVMPVAPAGFDHPVWFRAIEGDALVRTLLAAPLTERLVRAIVGQAYRQLAFARPRAIEPTVVRAFVSHLHTQRDVRRALATGRTLMPELADPFDLSAVTVPVRLVWGEKDRMVSHRGSRHLVAAVPHLSYDLLPGCGHCPQLEEPARFAELLEAFLAELAVRAG
ncbi:MAG: alpha/beta fold hydrolase [Solirubrobacterales bacterium]|nr:alpha/beta fold hydrolase [Solirubrobacterales bacterium]